MRSSFLLSVLLTFQAGQIALAHEKESEVSKESSTRAPVRSSEEMIEAGKKEVWYAYQNARGQWSYEAFFKLPELWAEQVPADAPNAEKEKARLKGLEAGQEDFWLELKKRYGLHKSPYENDNLPLGLTKTKKDYDDSNRGLSVNCQFCHSTYLPQKIGDKFEGKFAQGIPNTFADMERLHQDLTTIMEIGPGNVMVRNHERNTFNNHADFFGRLVPFLRNEDGGPNILRYNLIFRHMSGKTFPSYYAQDKKLMQEDFKQAPPIKTQPWVNYKYKTQGDHRLLYVNGGFDGDTTDVTYAMAFANRENGKEPGFDYKKAKQDFKEVGPAFLKSLKPLPYPFTIDKGAASRGKKLFEGKGNCYSCHGTYELRENRVELQDYPGIIVSLDEIKTDPLRVTWKPYKGKSDPKDRFIDGKLVRTEGYIAPPLVGIWSRAPYLHNGSVPNLQQLLSSKTREAKWFAMPDSSEANNFDQKNVGWKLISEKEITPEKLPYYRQYDPAAHVGLSNSGHTFGDHLSDTERADVIEYLKQL